MYVIVIVALLIIAALAAGLYLYLNVYYGIGNQQDVVRKGNEKAVKKKYVALTFDDGPSKEYTPKILNILKKNKMKATFFIVGKHAKENPLIVKRILNEGHEIGGHTYSHHQLVPLSTKKKAEKEIFGGIETIEKIIHKKIKYFRPPRGSFNQKIRKIIVSNGYKIILWSITTQDWRNPGVGYILNRVKNVNAGDIILMHDAGGMIKPKGMSRAQTIEALPKIIKELKKKGLKCVGISGMMKKVA